MKRSLTARDVMVDTVYTLKPHMTLDEAWSVLFEHRISGAPVVDKNDNLLGVLSQTDLVREAFVDELSEFPDNAFYLGIPFYDGGNYSRFADKLRTMTVEEVMTEDPVIASADDSVASIANRMRSSHIHRIIITEQDKVVGIVSSLDLLRLLENQ